MPVKRYSAVDNLEIMEDAENYNDFLKEQAVKYCGEAREALDFGAGIGTFSRALMQKGIKVTCVEPDNALLENLRTSGFDGYSSIADVPLGSFDYIFSLNVLEHIEDDLDAVKQLFSRLRPGGRLFLYLPAFEILFSSMDKKVGHFRRYTLHTANRLLEAAGYRVEKSAYVDSIGFIVTLLFKLVGNKRGDLNPGIIKAYDRILFPLSRLLDRLAGSLIGKNLMVTAIRPSEER